VFRGTANNLGGSFENQAGATVRLLGDGNFDQSILNVANGFTNSGVIELTSVVNAQNVTLNVSAGGLLNAPGAQINALAGTGGARTLGEIGRASCRERVEMSVVVDGSKEKKSNSGTINLRVGDLAVNLCGS